MHLVVMCARCGEPRMVRASQKTYTCFKCGYRGRVAEARVVAAADSPKRLPQVVAALKERIAKGEVRVVYDTTRVRGGKKLRSWG